MFQKYRERERERGKKEREEGRVGKGREGGKEGERKPVAQKHRHDLTETQQTCVLGTRRTPSQLRAATTGPW